MNAEVTNLPVKKVSLVASMAAKYQVDPEKMMETLKATCFKQRGEKQVTNEQMMTLLVVANEYNLNPFLKEIYAFPSDQGITPIIGFDGWIRLMNEHPQFDSMELAMAPDGSENPWVECTIWRKDRSRPVTIREYLDECARDTGPWKSHPRRMLRHKAIIQAARVVFGFGGVYDPDEGERIANAIDVTPVREESKQKPKTTPPRSKIRNEVHPEPEAKTEPAKAETTAPAEKATDDFITVDQANALRDQLREASMEESLLLAKFEIGDLSELTKVRYRSAMNSIG